MKTVSFHKKRPPLYGGLFSNHPGFYFFLLPVDLIHPQAQPLGPELEGIFRGAEPAQALNHGAGSPVNAGRDALAVTESRNSNSMLISPKPGPFPVMMLLSIPAVLLGSSKIGDSDP